ncbi:LTA synthase family protein [Tuberibacillus sp. Marseille-P3662]|uniref:LTA synthase family protein n=1 Tax=Tuberibacillus sp. Marseille-P3662 TaxID=1965358 RepID=UPI000A1CA224|nr:LTA synthase family protein [Tuberibacillus sp. Marseille-P3662]
MIWIKIYVVYKLVFDFPAHSFLEQIVLVLNPIGSIALILGCSFFFSKQLRPWLVICLVVVVTGILYANMLYYRFYIDFVTVPVLFQFQNVGGLSQSTLELIHGWDVLLFLDIPILIWLMKRREINGRFMTQRLKYKVAGTSVAIIALSMGLSLISHPQFLSKYYNRELLVSSLGLFNYHLYDIGLQISHPFNKAMADGLDTEETEDYVVQNNVKGGPADSFGVAEGKNLIFVMLESTQGFAIDKKLHGEAVTPFLNKLKEHSYYFDNFYHQTAQGKTSDAELMVDTGLYPLPSGSVFVRKPENAYNSLPDILGKQGYTSVALHGNVRDFWNRADMYDNLGYNHFYSKRDYHVTENNSVNYGLKDIPFIEQSMPYLSSLSEPFYAKFLLLTNHFPFLLDKEDRLIQKADTEEDVVNRYFTTVRYEDEAVKHLFSRLKEKGLYQNSVIVLMGDHYGISEKYSEALGEALDKKITPMTEVQFEKVPLLIHVPGQEGQVIHTVGGEIDVRPTLLHLLGVKTDQYVSFGQDLLSKQNDQFVVFRNGNFVSNKYVYTQNICYDAQSGEKVKRHKCWPYMQKAKKELHHSDQVIFGDLLRFTGDKMKSRPSQ